MWGMDRYERPPWTTGLFIACACIIAAAGGIAAFKEGKKVKRVEGVDPSPAVMAELEKMQREREREVEMDGVNAVKGDGRGDEQVDGNRKKGGV